MNNLRLKNITIAGLIAAVYVIISLVLLPISFGVYQIRVAEALAVLPFLTFAAIPGLFVGCLVANIFGGMGWIDILFGSTLTLLSAIITRWIANRKTISEKIRIALAPLPPVLINAFGVSLYLAPLIGVNYWFSVQMIGVGQLISCYIIGLPLLLIFKKRQIFN